MGFISKAIKNTLDSVKKPNASSGGKLDTGSVGLLNDNRLTSFQSYLK